MPEGPYKADHALTTPPPKDRTFHDIETLIQHFVNVSWGRLFRWRSLRHHRKTKGLNSYYLISDGGTMSYRTRIRTLFLICR